MRRIPLVLALGGLLAGAVVVAVPVLAADSATDTRATSGATAAAGVPAVHTYKVTLVTGDLVTVRTRGSGCPQVSVTPVAPGRAVSRVCLPNGHVRVLPADAAPLVGSRLDPALFDVNTLIENGYDDAHSTTTPLIVEYADAAKAKATSTFGGHLQRRRSLPSIRGVAGRQAKRDSAPLRGALRALASPGAAVRHISLDRKVTVAPCPASSPVDGNLSQVSAPAAWSAGYTGKGVRVAVLDTGIDATHPDFAGKVAESADFSDDGDIVDRYGHGTHVAATIAGTGAASGGRHRGVAPDAQLVVGKVLGATGEGSDSQVIAGMEWAASRAPVVNMSLGGYVPDDGSDPTARAVDALTAQYGALFVISAGNAGPDDRSVTAPGSAGSALTVGAVDAKDAVADFSSRGPLTGTGAVKPEIVAPGVDIVSARAVGTTIGLPIDERYVVLSGTSMAAPHVAGAAAILKQRHPDWASGTIKNDLIGAADPVAGADAYLAGSGRLDVAKALAAPVPTSPVADLGTLAYPQTGIKSTTLGWTNPGASPVTLALSVSLTDRHGVAAPDGAATLPSGSVRIGAGGSATAELRIAGAKLAAKPGYYTGMVTARAGDQVQVRTPVAVFVEGPSATLTVRTKPLPGTPEDAYASYGLVVNLDDPNVFTSFVGVPYGAEATLRVPKGRYSVTGEIDDGTPGAVRSALAGDPDVTVNADTTVVFDGTKAHVMRASVDGVPTQELALTLGFLQSGRRGSPWGMALYAWYDMDQDWAVATLMATPMAGASVGSFSSAQYASLGAPGTGPSPYLYDVMRFGTGFGADPSYRLGKAEQARLARIDQHFDRIDVTGTSTGHKRYGLSPDGMWIFGEHATDQVPTTRTDYVSPGALWDDEAFYGGVLDYGVVVEETTRQYAPGSRQEKTWIRQPLRSDWFDEPAEPLSFCQPAPITRTSGNLHVTLVDLVDAHGRFDCLWGDDTWGAKRQLTLYRDGRQIGQVGTDYADFPIPREAGTYRLVYDLDASAVMPVSTRVATAWTFRSTGPASNGSVPVPLLSVDYALPLDSANHPVAGPATFTVRQARGVPAQKISSVAVWTSTDDGATWVKAPVTVAGGDRFTAGLPTVASGQAVSLRVQATGDGGSGVEQTIIRAYRA